MLHVSVAPSPPVRSEVQSSTVGRLLVVILEGVDLGAGTGKLDGNGRGRCNG